MKSKRFEVLAARPVNQDGYVQEWPEVGLIAMNSPFDPKPSIKIENGVITEMDGKCRADFDMLDTFIADHAIRPGNAEKAMAMDSLEIARKIVDINVSREEILDITLSLTPAKLTEVVGKLNIVEIMMGMTKMRARMMPANQCHVTNVRDNPVQIAADAAEAGVRGFAEMETTVAVARYAPFNAMALFVGAQVGRPGVMTQCALEEATELQLGMRGFTTYAETISVYGTEPVFMDGDDNAPLKMRSALVPVVNFASSIMTWVLLGGILLINSFPQLLWAGIILFAMTTLFSFITLPVEINASKRALVWLSSSGITNARNHTQAEDALRSAAYTYVVAALGSLATLVYYIMIFMGRRE